MAQHETSKTPHEPKAEAKPAFPFPMGFSEWMKPESWTRFASAEPMARAFEEQVQRLGAMAEELAKVEKSAIEQVHTAVQEMSRLTLAGIDYSTRIAGEMRRSALEASRRSAEIFRARG